MERDLPWGLFLIGAVLAIVMQLCGVSALAFAVGVYLPLSTTLPIFVGGMVRKLVDRLPQVTDAEADMSPGTLMSTGLIAGGSIAGIFAAFLIFVPTLKKSLDFATNGNIESFAVDSLLAFTVLVAALVAVAFLGRRPNVGEASGPDHPKLGEIGEV